MADSQESAGGLVKSQTAVPRSVRRGSRGYHETIFKRNTVIYSTCWTQCKLLTPDSPQLQHQVVTTFILMMLHLCEGDFQELLQKKCHGKANMEQEMLVAVSNLTPRFEKLYNVQKAQTSYQQKTVLKNKNTIFLSIYMYYFLKMLLGFRPI